MNDLFKLTKEELINEVQQLRSELKNSDTTKIEKLAKESGRRFTEILKSVNLVSIILDTEGNIEFCNNFLLYKTGYKKEEIIDKNWFDIFIPEDISDQIKKVFVDAVTSGNFVTSMENEIVAKNGNRIFVSWSNTLLKGTEGEIIGVASLGEDITEKRKAVELLEKSEAKFRKLFDNATFGILVCQLVKDENGKDKDYIILQANDSIFNHLGIHAKDIIGKRASDIIPAEETSYFIEKFAEVVKTGKPYEYTKYYPSFDRIVDNRSFYLENDFFAIIFFDITEQKRAEEALQKSNSLLTSIIDSPNNIIMLASDVEFNYLSFNQAHIDAVRHTYGTEPEIGKSILSYMPVEEDRLKAIANYKRVLKGERFVEIQEFGTEETKSTWELIFNPIINKSDQITGFTVFVHDITEQKKAEFKVRENEERFRTIFEQSASGMCLTGLDGSFLKVNKPLCEMLGYSAPELEGKHFNAITYPEDLNIGAESVKKMISGESKKVAFEKRYLTKSGEVIWVRINSALLNDQDNKPFYFITQMEDVTQRVNTDIQLKISENKYKALVEQSLTGIYLFNKESFIYVNNRFCEIFGYTEKYILSTLKPTDVIATEDRDVANNNVDKRLSGEINTIRYSARGNHKNGQELWVEIHGSHIELNGEDVITGTVLDITERKLSEIELKERNEYIESVMENMPIGFALNTIDDGDVKYMNKHFEDIYGWSREILTNTSFFFDKVFPEPDYREKMKSQIIADMQSSDPKRMDWKDLKIFTSTGEVRYVHAFNIPLVDQNLMISTVQDTTSRKLAEDEVKKHREHLEELVKERTKNIDEKNIELERMNKLFVGRELRMKELKGIIKELKERLENR